MSFELKFSNSAMNDVAVETTVSDKRKCIIVACDNDDAFYEKFYADVSLAEGVYHFRDNKTDGILAFVFDEDISYERFMIVYQFYFRVKRNCNFMIVAPSMIENNEKYVAAYCAMHRDFAVLLMSEKDYHDLDGFDYEQHKALADDKQEDFD